MKHLGEYWGYRYKAERGKMVKLFGEAEITDIMGVFDTYLFAVFHW